ncbi:MAG: acetylornithine deacetylase [Gaiellales bacterium]|nr:acetylornithine deacetylase [Gaiellales bacterium]
MADALVDLLARLVSFPTIAGESNLEFVSFVAGRLEALGARVSVLPGTRPDARNLYAVLGPDELPGGLLLAAHGDVVAVEGQPWTRDPFTLDEADGRLYGRGTADMKGSLACMLAALAAVDAGALRAPVHLAVSSDEELGCAGVPPLLDALAALAAPPSRVLVGEPTSLRVATAHKGKAAMRIVLTGRAAHSSVAATGVNAVAYAGRLIGELLALQDEISGEQRDDAFAVPYSSIGIGPIEGGVSVNIVPDSCRLDVEVRSLPGRDPAEIVARIRALADALEREMQATAREARIEFEPRASYPGLASSPGGFAAQVAEIAGDRAAPLSLDFGTEAGLYQQRLGIPVVICGPGSMEQAHKADEFITVEQLVAGAAFVERLLTR